MSSKYKQSETYSAVLKRSLSLVQKFFIITAVGHFLYGSRTSIWLSYASTFDDFSITIFSWIMCIDSILIGLVGMFFCTLSDYIGFGKSMTIKTFIIAMGCIVEALAPTFKILCIGFIISQTATMYVTMGYISWILPTKYAKKEIIKLYAISAASALIGAMFSGALFKLFNQYQLIFIINAYLTTIISIFSFLCIFGKQKRLEIQQIASCTEFAPTNTENLLLIHHNKNKNKNNNEDDIINVDVKFSNNDLENLFPSFISLKRNKITTVSKQTYIEKIKIVIYLIEIGLMVFTGILATYWIQFLVKKYDDKKEEDIVLFGSLILVVISLSFIITTFILSKTNVFMRTIYNYINPNLLVIISVILFSGINVLFLYDKFNVNMSIYLYFIYGIIVGGLIAFPQTMLEWLLLETIPKQHSGKINGLKAFMINLMRGVYLLFIGLLWDKTENAIFIPVLVGCSMIVVLSVLLWLLHM
eukprot:71838_1